MGISNPGHETQGEPAITPAPRATHSFAFSGVSMPFTITGSPDSFAMNSISAKVRFFLKLAVKLYAPPPAGGFGIFGNVREDGIAKPFLLSASRLAGHSMSTVNTIAVQPAALARWIVSRFNPGSTM